MSKKIILALMLMMAVLIGCGKSEQVSQSKEGKKMVIGYCMPDTSEAFLADLSNKVKEKFAADGVEVQIANAAGDSATQVQQIENFVTMGVDLIIVMAVDPTGVTDTIKRAQEKGIKVMVAGSDTGAYDSLMFTDQLEDGKLIAKMASDWISKTFPNAAHKSIKAAILESRDTPEANKRCDGIAEINKLSPAVDVVKVVGGVKNNDTAQAAMENLFQTNPDVSVVLSYNSGGALGVNTFAMRPGSPIKDKSKFAVFASDLDPEVLQAIKDSTNNSIVRGIVKFGGDDLAQDTYALAKKMINNEAFEKLNPDPLTAITLENADKF